MRFSRSSITTVLLTVVLAAPAASIHAGEAALTAKPRDVAEAIAACKELAKKDEKDLTYLGVVLAASRVLKPDLDCDAIDKQIQEMASKVTRETSLVTDAKGKVAATNKVIFKDYGFHTDTGGAKDTAIFEFEDGLDDSMLDRVLPRKSGVCLGLSTLYLVVCERAKLPVIGVHAPYHIFCRYNEGNENINIECTAAGMRTQDKQVAIRTGATDAAMSSDMYFKPITKKQLLSDQLNNMAYSLATRKRGPAPLTMAQVGEIADLAAKLQPKAHEVLDTAGLLQFKNGNAVRALQICDQAIALAKEYGGPQPTLPQYEQRKTEYEEAIAKNKRQPQPAGSK